MAYLGNDLQVAFPVYRNIDDISGSFNSSTTSFPLRVSGVAPVPAPLYSQQCLISVGGVVQRPDDSGSEGFRLSGGNIIFASAPTTGADFFGVILAGADYINAGGNFPSGTAAVPSITFNDDLDTGIYNSGINQVSITTGGSERLRIDSAGQIESVSLGTAAAPAFSFTTDPNTGIYSPGADQVAISTNGTGRLFVNSSGELSVGGTAIVSSSANRGNISINGVSSSILGFYNNSLPKGYLFHGGTDMSLENSAAGALIFNTNGTERLRITSNGTLLLGTSSARGNFFNTTGLTPGIQLEGSSFQNRFLGLISSDNGGPGSCAGIIMARQKSGSVGGNTIVANNDSLGLLTFQGSDGTEFVDGARIEAFVDGTPGNNDMPGRLVFSTTADGASSPTERMRIDNAGYVMIGATSFAGKGLSLQPNGGIISDYNGTATFTHFEIKNNNGTVGSIQSTGSSTAYNTSSDYRLKENVTQVTDGITRLQQLKPSRFNFIADPTKTVDGFLAHEVQAIVPEAITGEKDAVDNDGNPQYQGIDQSKLVPLLTAALQEAIAKIESLEARLTAAGI